MNTKSKLQSQLTEFFGSSIVQWQPIGGGSIAQAAKIKLESGACYFIKYGNLPNDMFLKEANGLLALSKSTAIATPKIIKVTPAYLVLEYLEQGVKPGSFQSDFGVKLAKHHRHTGHEFGFYEDNYIGRSKQYNNASTEEKSNWALFYFNKRLLPQYKWCEQNGYADQKLKKAFSKLSNKLDDIIGPSAEAPSLLHGDLWAGNYLCNQKGEPVLIDPAVYYGNREADLAMTKMFGGFESEFYRAYREEYPLSEGYDYRENIYLLYHYLNHLNLFGTSYYQSSLKLMEYYI